MWFKEEIFYPRVTKSFMWMIIIQELYFASLFLLLKLIAWNPLSGIIEWLYYLMHWKLLLYRFVLYMSTVAFGALNLRFYCVEKYICSTRMEKICKALSPHRIQHFFISLLLGGVASYCCMGIFQNFDPFRRSLFSSCFILDNNLEQQFVVMHGCYSGIMFSLKYFICHSYLLKVSLYQEAKMLFLKHSIAELVKESVFCVLKAMVWYYLMFVIMGSFMGYSSFASGAKLSQSEDTLFNLINYRLFLVTFITGVVVFVNWSLYLIIFNTFTCERHIFPIKMLTKSDVDKSLPAVLATAQCDLLKYLAVMDLRLLSQNDQLRRSDIFSISHPGGHPHHWKALSEFCISSLKDFAQKLNEYSLSKAPQAEKLKVPGISLTFDRTLLNNNIDCHEEIQNTSEKVSQYFRGWPAVAYFMDELPSTKIRHLFVSSEPLIWIAETLGFLVCASYTEDKFGVVQKNLPQIICLFLDLKMAEEKLPIDSVGVRMHVKDPQGRYEHLHQRIALKTAVNNSLCRIADTYKNDIGGICLPNEYQRYFERYLKKKIL